MRSSILYAGAWLLISPISVYAATPEQLYQTWQQNTRLQPEIAEKAAEDYLHAAPTGPHAHSLQIWLDAYHKALASLLSGPQSSSPQARQSVPAAKQGAPAAKQASAQPPKPAVTLPAAPAVRPPETRQASAVPGEKDAQKKQLSNAPQNNRPGAKPKGPSLAEALAFIADRLDSEGRINFTAQFHDIAADRDLAEQLSYQANDVTIDPNRCELSFRWHVEQDKKAMPDQDRTVELRLAKSITLETIDQALTDINAAAGQHYSVRAQPEAYAVHIGRWDKPSADHLYFRDKDMAERVSEVTKQALGLCDEGTRPPSRQR